MFVAYVVIKLHSQIISKDMFFRNNTDPLIKQKM